MPPRTKHTSNRPAARPLRALAIALAAVLAGVLLAACGGSSGDPGGAAGERAQEAKAEAKNADFARCLREHGISAEAVSGPNGGHGLKISGGGKSGPEGMEAAQKACAKYQPEPKKLNLSPQQKVEQEEAVQKFAKCMREHGIKVEAQANGGAIRIGIHSRPGSGEPNPESPGFQAAQNDCQKLLPKPPGAGKGGGPFRAPPSKGSSSASEGSSSQGLSMSAGN